MVGSHGRATSLQAFIQAHRLAIGIVTVALMLGLTALMVIDPLRVREIRQYGYLGVFLITLLGTAAVIVPVPYIVAIGMSTTWGLNPLTVAVVAGIAAALGELVGYIAGLAGNTLLPDHRFIRWLESIMVRFGGIVVFAASFLPNPFFDAVGILAGAARTPLWVFLITCFAGKALRFWLIAAGAAAFLAGIGHPNLFG